MDSFDGLLPALFSFLSNNYRARGSQPHNLPARSPCLDHHLAAADNHYNSSAGGGGGGGADTQWKLLRQSSINSITDSARGCLSGLPFWRPAAMPAASASAAAGPTGLYAKLRSKMERKVLLSSARLNCSALPITTTTTHHHHQRALDAPSNEDFYQALSGYP